MRNRFAREKPALYAAATELGGFGKLVFVETPRKREPPGLLYTKTQID